MNQTAEKLVPGTRVTITQQVPRKQQTWTTTVTGTVEKAEQCKTGSWYNNSKDDKLWLDRVIIRKDDGEIYVCNLDQFTKIEVQN